MSDTQAVYEQKVAPYHKNLLRALANELSVNVRESTLDSIVKNILSDQLSIELVTEGLKILLAELNFNYERTGEKTSEFPKYATIKIKIDEAARAKRLLEKNKESQVKADQASANLERARKTLKRAIEKYGFEATKKHCDDYICVSCDGEPLIKISATDEESLWRWPFIEPVMLNLFDAKGDMELALKNLQEKFQQDQSA